MRRPALRRSLDARPGSATAAGLRLALAMLLLGAATASADPPRIYKWVDSNGIAHYTTDPDRIPKALRNRIESVERTRPTPEAAAATSPR